MEMKRNLLLLIGLCMAVCVQAQKKNFSYKFYGQVRGDLFYNSRANAEIVDGLFHLYPKDVALDADGKDLNASPNGSFYRFTPVWESMYKDRRLVRPRLP